ncbi:MAG: hypothetical protein OXS29_18835 [bacterium]|nr:hypothetical protein [bacterium]MDE0439481.1 hypothetical protein [bacterium]
MLSEAMDTNTDTVPALPGRVVVPPLYEATVATAIELEVGVATLDSGDADAFNWRPGIPDDLPSTGYIG